MRFKNDLVTPGPGAYNPPASRFDKIVRKPGNGTFSKGKWNFKSVGWRDFNFTYIINKIL